MPPTQSHPPQATQPGAPWALSPLRVFARSEHSEEEANPHLRLCQERAQRGESKPPPPSLREVNTQCGRRSNPVLSKEKVCHAGKANALSGIQASQKDSRPRIMALPFPG